MDVQYHEQKLLDIKDEVKELHRLLKNLLPKIENIKHCEYTHGVNEMGSDFVLKKEIHTPYVNLVSIGVVAKIGKIHQNFDDIERQIDESFLVERTIANGREKIKIAEVWVVATDIITNGAKEKIYEKFKSRTVYFIDGKQLATILFNKIPNYWENIAPELMTFLTDILKETEKKDKQFNLLQNFNGEFYINPRIIELRQTRYLDKKRAHSPAEIDIKEVIDSEQFIIIEGSMGSGKSKLIRNLITYFATPEIFERKKRIPIFVTFKDFIEEYKCNLKNVINNALNKIINKDYLPDDINYIIFIDAIDEIDLQNEKIFEYLNNIKIQLSETKNIKILSTIRDLDKIGNNGNIFNLAFICYIASLSLEQVTNVIKTVCKNVSTHDRLFNDLKKSQLFKNIPKNPITAILLANIINQNSNDLPSNLTELYSKYMEIIVGRWDINKDMSSSKEYDAAHKILMNISEFMLDNELNTISILEAKNFVITYLKERNIAIEPDILFKKIIERCEIITVNCDKHIFTFKHKSFVEFLYAEQMFKKGNMVIDNRTFNPYWIGMMFFYIGLKKDCPDDLNKIINLTPTTPIERIVKIFNTADYFMAGYSTPINVIENGIVKIMLEASQLFFDITNGSFESNLSKLSRMDILAFLRYFIKTFYSYEFLKIPMINASFDITKENVDEKLKIYALYFISIVLIELKEEGFDTILNEYSKSIPLEIQLAIYNDCNSTEERKKLLKHQCQVIKKIFKKTKITDTQKKQLFDIPAFMTKEFKKSKN